MRDKFTFWCRYEVPRSIPDEHMVEKWPRGMKGWISGYSGNGTTIWCARVDSATPEDAERVVRRCYGKSSSKIEMSWEPEQKPLGWRPTGGRFPE
jgi:hypothetical protein